MVLRRLIWMLLVAGVAYGLYRWSPDGLRGLADLARASPHERYAGALRRAGLHEAAVGRAWLEAAEASLARATDATVPHREVVWFSSTEPDAVAFEVPLRRGQRFVADATAESTTPVRVFVDVFERRDGSVEHVASAPDDQSIVETVIRRDGRYLVRVQVELLRDARVTLTQNVDPTLRMPVENATRTSIQSLFRDPRDGGRREHHGVDIFARRGTPVVAGADGVVSSVRTNALGGKVVFVAVPGWRETHYYAHLNEQLVEAGTRVAAGDVLGTVGNTGNARATPPHLHFGIYTFGRGPVDPLPYLAPAAPPPPVQASTGRLGELARLRRTHAIPSTPDARDRGAPRLAAGTVMRVVGATGRAHRVRLPDGVEGYVPAGALEPADEPMRVIRPREDVTLLATASDDLVIDTLPPAAPLDVLGRYAGATLVRTRDSRTGWIR